MRRVLSLMCLMGILCAAPHFGWAMSNLKAPDADTALIGKEAYDVTLPSSAGGQKSLSQLRAGKRAVVFFWATWCPHCHEELARVNRIFNDVRSKGVEIILVDVGETPAEVKAYLTNKGYTFESLIDEENVLQDPYQIVGVPTIVFINEKGIIRHVGYEFPDDFEVYFNAVP